MKICRPVFVLSLGIFIAAGLTATTPQVAYARTCRDQRGMVVPCPDRKKTPTDVPPSATPTATLVQGGGQQWTPTPTLVQGGGKLVTSTPTSPGGGQQVQGGGQQWTATPALQGGGGRDPGGGQPGGWWPWLILLGLLAAAAGGMAKYYLPKKNTGNVQYQDVGTQEPGTDFYSNPKEFEIDKTSNWGKGGADDFSSPIDGMNQNNAADLDSQAHVQDMGSQGKSTGGRPKKKWPF